MIPPFFRAPLPPLLARLHAILDAWAEESDEAVVIVEQDRLVKPGDPPPGLPVVVVVPARPRPGAATGRVAPDLIAELVEGPGPSAREAKYARNDVREYWRVEPGPPLRIVVCSDPDPAAGRYRTLTPHAGDEPVRSQVVPALALRPADLESGS